MRKNTSSHAHSETRLRDTAGSEGLLLQIDSDRRLGHEWEDWDGSRLPGNGVFDASEGIFFRLAAIWGTAWIVVLGSLLWLVEPRLAALWPMAGRYLAAGVGGAWLLWIVWLLSIASVVRWGRNWLPTWMAERGLVPWLMPHLEKRAKWVGTSRDQAGNALVRVFNRLAITRGRANVFPEDLLILLPRCLGKDAMRQAMKISESYGVPLFVAARGRYARQMIAMRKPKAVVAVACERDLVSGIHDVSRALPVFGTTLGLGEGPCRNTTFSVADLESQVRALLGLQAPRPASLGPGCEEVD